MPKRVKELSALEVGRLKSNGMHPVGGIPGLYLQVTGPARSWILRMMVGSKRRDMGLGSFPAVTLAAAREKARDAREKVAAGVDPIRERSEAQSLLRTKQLKAVNFETAMQTYLAAKEGEWKNPKHRQQWENSLKNYAIPVLGPVLVEQQAKLEAAQAAFSLLTADQLCTQNRDLFKEPLSPHHPRPIALLWLINLELTKRGIGPRWRGAPGYLAPQAHPVLPPLALASGQPHPISYGERRRIMLRWIDLQWLSAQLGPTHIPEQGNWRDVFRWGLCEGIATQIAHSPSSPHRLLGRLGVPDLHCYSLQALLTQGCTKRLKTIREKRLKRAKESLLRHATLTTPQLARRLRWIEAIEVTNGSPTNSARYFGWMTGATPSKQSAAEMREKLAKQLGYRTACWR